MLFIIIIGGLASIRGAFFGAAFIVIFPLLLSRIGASVFGSTDSGVVELVETMVVGLLIILFLIAEPKGLVALWDRRLAPILFTRRKVSSS